jgi:hypothetical protein
MHTPHTPTMRRAAQRLLLLTTVCGVASGCSRPRSGNTVQVRGTDTTAVFRLAQRTWRGAGVLSGQREPACDTLVVAIPTTQCGTRTPVDAATLAEFARLASTLDTVTTPERLRTLAALDLVVDQADLPALNRAVESLADASNDPRASTAVLIDHAAVRLQRYAIGHELVDLLEALEAASTAVARDSTNWHACWNRALAVTWAGLRRESARAWRRCATLNHDTRARAAAIVIDSAPSMSPVATALSGRWPEATREYAWAVALPEWSRAMLLGDATLIATRQAPLDSLIVLLRENGLDQGVASARVAFVAATQEGDGIRAKQLRRAFEIYAYARSSAGKQNPTASLVLLDSALQLTRDVADLQRWLALERANFQLLIGRSTQAALAYRTLLDQAPADAPLFRLRSAFGEGFAFASLGRTSESLARALQTEEQSAAIHAYDLRTAAAVMSSEFAALLGDDVAAELAAQHAIMASALNPLSQWYWSTSHILSEIADLRGMTHSANVFSDEAIEVAQALDRADLATIISYERTRSALEHSDTIAAKLRLSDFRDRWVPTQTVQNQARSQIDLLYAMGELARSSNPAAAVRLLDSALTLSEADNNHALRTPLRIARAKSLLALGDTGTALYLMDSLLTAIRARAPTRQTVYAAARLDRVIGEVARLSAEVLRARAEFGASYRAINGSPFLEPRQAAAWRSRRDAQTIAVRIIRDSAWIWDATQIGARLRVVPLPRSVVRKAMRLDPIALTEIHRRVIGLYAQPTTVSDLCIDARGIAAQIPWNAVRNPHSGRFLVEEARVRLIADASTGCASETSAGAKLRAVTLIDAAASAGENSLPAAVREISSLRGIWSGQSAVTVVGGDRARVLRAMTGADLIHFAGHAIFNRSRPENSYLSLGTSGESRLTGSQLGEVHLPLTRLVVLSACESTGSSEGLLGGFDSLAGAFLNAGARNVIGAAWPVDDSPTAVLMQAVHQAMREGHSPAKALRGAQLDAIRSNDPALNSPRVWAAFQLMGSAEKS